MGELLDIVGAMRSLASMRLQEAHRALPGIRRYSETMAEAIGAALAAGPESATPGAAGEGRPGACSVHGEHGFVGGFQRTGSRRSAKPSPTMFSLFVLGSRGSARWRRSECRPLDWTQPMASRPEGVPEAVRHVTAELYRLVVRGEIDRAEVVFARHRQGSADGDRAANPCSRSICTLVCAATFEAAAAAQPAGRGAARKAHRRPCLALLTEAADRSRSPARMRALRRDGGGA